MLAEPGIAYAAPDRHAVLVMNEILGGAYSSRIFRNLREEHAYSYGAFSSFTMRRGPGPFSAGGSIDAAHVADAVRELLREVVAIRDADVTPEELATAKRHLALSQTARFESASDVTRALGVIAIHELGLDEWSTFAARVDRVTISDVRRAANEHLHPDRMKIVVTGDRELVPALVSLGFGAVEIRDADGAVVTDR
jgi:zinc protease